MHVYQPIDDDKIWMVAWVYPANNKIAPNDIRDWCYNMFGKPCLEGTRLSSTNNKWKDDIKWGVIEFKYEKDANWFLLKYGSEF